MFISHAVFNHILISLLIASMFWNVLNRDNHFDVYQSMKLIPPKQTWRNLHLIYCIICIEKMLNARRWLKTLTMLFHRSAFIPYTLNTYIYFALWFSLDYVGLLSNVLLFFILPKMSCIIEIHQFVFTPI